MPKLYAAYSGIRALVEGFESLLHRHIRYTKSPDLPCERRGFFVCVRFSCQPYAVISRHIGEITNLLSERLGPGKKCADAYLVIIEPLAIGRGVALGLLFSATIYGIQKLGKSDNQSRPAKRAALYAVPLSGALTLGTTTILAFSGPDIGLSAFVMACLVGAFLSMLAGWPVLWFIERYLKTPLRYIAGGIVTGLLIWLCFTLENLVQAMHAMLSAGDHALPKSFLEGAVFFAFTGMLAGMVCTGIILGCERLGLNRRGSSLRP
ncbi:MULTISPECIES: hypothetical protein [Pseudomonas]|uniref:hypothetical protein n=1 Tax=Pseudomonas TaxID=286 RepID=UPI001E51500C|nr:MULTISPECIES: hypothetical protein [Pseudomonas]MCD5983701.1 hypothetical protein [Pseudomonas sp. CDFA 610]MCQ9472301.1 hypothetical protein [Pseudomonas alliivorans]